MINVGIVEDNNYMREGWKTFINFEKDMQVIGSFGSCEEALSAKNLDQIDVMLMDIGLPGISGIEGVGLLLQKYPRIAVIMATVFDDDDHVFDALRAGAVGYLMKKVNPDEMVQAIRDAKNGGSPITPNIARKLISTFQKKVPSNSEVLSEREHSILKELSIGKSYAAIGARIFLTEDGIRHHIRNIYRKLQVNSKAEAISKGIKAGLI